MLNISPRLCLIIAKLATGILNTIHKLKRNVNSVINEVKRKIIYKEHIARLEKESISSKANLPMLEVLRKYKYCAYI